MQEGSLAEAVEGLGEALDALASVEPAAAADAELSEALVVLATARARLEGMEAALLSTWDKRKVWVDDKARSGAAWLAYRCRLPLAWARAKVRFARDLAACEKTERALIGGEIHTAHARRLTEAARCSRTAFDRDEAQLLEYARDMRYSEFHQAVAYWEQFADPDRAERNAKADDDSRSLHMSQTLGGTWVIDGVGSAVGGTIVHSVLSRVERELFEADWAEAKARVGDGVSLADLARTAPQRRFDALVEMATRAATAPRDGRRPVPLFSALVDYPSTMERICELASGTVVTPGQLAPWLSSAELERIVFGPSSRVIDVGVRQRLFQGATRRAVEVRDRFCTGFACEEPADRCDVDHAERYSDDGPTTQDNGRLRCPFHNPGRRKEQARPDQEGRDPP